MPDPYQTSMVDPSAAAATGSAPAANPFLPDKYQMLGMMLAGMGSGISQAAARNQPFYMGISPGVQNFNNSYYGMLSNGLNYDLARKKYELDASYRNAEMRKMGLETGILQRQQDMFEKLMKGGGIPGFQPPQAPLLGPGSTPTPQSAAEPPQAPSVPFDPSKLPGGTTPLNAILADAQTKFGNLPMPSGDRTPEHNAEVGGAQNSQHLQPGKAYDIPWPANATPEQKQQIAQWFQNNPNVGGVGLYPNHIHVDVGPQGRRWGSLPGAMPTQAPAASSPAGGPQMPQMPGPPPDVSRYSLYSLGGPLMGKIGEGLAARDLSQYKYQSDQFNREMEALKYRQSSANQSVAIGPDGKPVIQQAPIQAKAAEAAAVEEAKRQGHLNSILPEGWEGMQPDELRAKMNPLIVKSADQLASFDKPLSQLPARLGGGNGITKDELMSVTQLLHPDWTPLKAENREKFVAYMQPDKQGGQTTAAIGNAAQHLTEAAEAFNEMKNGNLPLGNRLFNTLKTQNGWGNEVAFDTVKEAIGTEVAKAIAGTGDTSVSEREAHRELMDAASSPEQMQKVMARYAGLFGKRINTLNSQAKAVGLGPDWVEARIGEEGVKALKELPNTIKGASAEAPAAAISHLRANPGLAAAFDQKYGAGSAAKVLGK